MSMDMTLAHVGHESWAPRRRMTLNAARQRSALVKILRFTFILLALATFAVVVAFIMISAGKPAPVAPVVPVQQAEVNEGEVQMINPLYTGHTDAKRSYEVRAETAVSRTDAGEGVTDLVNPRMITDPTREDSSEVTAEAGIYDATNGILDLHGDVQLGTTNGYTYTTDHAKIIIGEDRIVGDEAVTGVGPLGSIDADSYVIENGGEVLKFKGRVKTRISFGKSKDEDKKEDQQ